MLYENYQVSDFVTDDFFRKWVLSPDEKTQTYWQNWIREHPDKQSVIKQARLLVLMTNIDPINTNKETQRETWENISHALDEKVAPPTPNRKIHPRSSVSWLKIAATITGILLVSFYASYHFLFSAKEYRTGYGEVLTVELPDGSIALLNANSTLQITPHWQSRREVWLEGEAFFSVEKSLTPATKKEETMYRKFTVHAGEVAVEVLGTRFNVQNRKKTTQIVLEEGIVSLKENSQTTQEQIQLAEGEVATYLPDNKTFRRELADTESLLSWKENMHVFKAAYLHEVADVIENIYGYQVRVPSE
ncbi:MAG: FecR domain-containing protein, partial [Bacteroidota bacterium]